MSTFNRSTLFVRNAVALMAITGAGVAAMYAQTPAVKPTAVQAQPSLDLRLPALDTSSDRLFSSSADEDAAAPVAVASLHPTVVNFGEGMQYGGGQRRRYGRPRYRGANTNADGSSKYIFYGGAGMAQPIGNTFHYDTPSWGLQVGGGRQFNNKFAVPIEFDYDHLGLAGETLTNQINLYNNDINYYCTLNATNLANCEADGVTDYSALDGNAHVWSFSVDPTYTFFHGETVGAYAVAGVGFYHKVTNFLAPETGCDPYYLEFYGICEEVQENAIIDHYTSNAPGFSAGLGVTYKFSHFSNERFYAEVRYVFVDNSYRPGVTVNSPVATTYAEANDYPANSNRTSYIPIKVGIRF